MTPTNDEIECAQAEVESLKTSLGGTGAESAPESVSPDTVLRLLELVNKLIAWWKTR